MKEIAIMLGGPSANLPKNWDDLHPVDKWIGVDAGAIRLLEKGIQPILSLGDFDSVNPSELRVIKEKSLAFKQVPAEKDYTDSQLAIIEAEDRFKPESIYIYGGTGGRLDHTMSLFFTPTTPDFRPVLEKIILRDLQNEVTYFGPGDHLVQKNPQMDYVGIMAVSPVKSLSLFDFKYGLKNQDVPHVYSYGSNEFLEKKARISFESGLLAVIQSKDK